MKFQITPEAKQLILNHGCQITVSIEREECYACAGQVMIPYPSARLGRPKDSQVAEYEIVFADDIKAYVHNELYNFDISTIFAIDLSDSPNETLVIYGVASDS
jgi:hypothetical protein